MTFGRVIGEVLLNRELAPEDSALVRRSDGSFYFCLHISDVRFIDNHLHAYLYASRLTIRRLLLAFLHLLRQ